MLIKTQPNLPKNQSSAKLPTTEPADTNSKTDLDTFRRTDGIGDALLTIGTSGLDGALIGAGVYGITTMAEALGGPTAGLIARGAVATTAAVLAVDKFGDNAVRNTGSKALGKTIAATVGLGGAAMAMGVGSMGGAVAVGGFLGVLLTPRG